MPYFFLRTYGWLAVVASPMLRLAVFLLSLMAAAEQILLEAVNFYFLFVFDLLILCCGSEGSL